MKPRKISIATQASAQPKQQSMQIEQQQAA